MAQSGAHISRILTVVALSVVLIGALVAVDIVTLNKDRGAALNPHYYMALGNSLSFGYQPNLDFSSGFADDIVNELNKASATEIINYACPGETTTTMIQGGCIGRYAHKGSYTGSQLLAATAFLTKPRYRGRVSPVTLEIGANDVLPDYDTATCSASAKAGDDLATMDDNLTRVILPDLLDALKTPRGAIAGDLHLLNFYNPFAQICPSSSAYVHVLNDHLLADAQKYRVAVIDVYSWFGGDTGMAQNICTFTWMCDPSFHDIHPTNAGYLRIAQAVESALGLPGAPLPGIAPPLTSAPQPANVAFWRRPDAALSV